MAYVPELPVFVVAVLPALSTVCTLMFGSTPPEVPSVNKPLTLKVRIAALAIATCNLPAML